MAKKRSYRIDEINNPWAIKMLHDRIYRLEDSVKKYQDLLEDSQKICTDLKVNNARYKQKEAWNTTIEVIKFVATCALAVSTNYFASWAWIWSLVGMIASAFLYIGLLVSQRE